MGGSKRCLTACFTGHRPERLGGYGNNPTQQATRTELARIIGDLSTKYDILKFYSGMALGVDTWAAELVELIGHLDNPEQHRIRLTAIIPFVGQQNNWPLESQMHWAKLIHKADDLYFVDEGAYAPWKLMKRNKWMVDNSDLVIAVWDGSDEGGTANCVKYAIKQQKEIINLWPAIQESLKQS